MSAKVRLAGGLERLKGRNRGPEWARYRRVEAAIANQFDFL